MDYPFISVHKPAAPVFGSRTALVRVPLVKITQNMKLAAILCWLAMLVIIPGGGGVLVWSARHYAQRPAGAGEAKEIRAEEGADAVDEQREAVRTLIVQVMDRGRTAYRPPVDLSKLPAARPLEFDFESVRQGDELRRSGDLCLEQGRVEEAVKACCAALKKNPRNNNVWQSLGNGYLRAGNYEMAKRMLETAFRLGSVKADLMADLGALYRREGRLGEALALWDQCRQVAGSAPQADLNEGLAWLEAEDFERAALILERYVGRVPQDTAASRALAYAQLQQGDWAEARRTLKKALAEAPGSAELRADAAAVAAHGWLAHETLEHLEQLARMTSPDLAYQYLHYPAFAGFRKTMLGRGLEAVLLADTGRTVLSPEEVRERLAVDISPRFSHVPGTSAASEGEPISSP
ncbi:MAG TPA: tetratricopeptide repeat protein [Kiritimatiellia bacterium]|nr:tetratricopeptide repeat protein [Kiritimatiellia bacterium]HRZ13706.1 tetratricopeptide repeat protein [Kiritimatiellia bacterium]HSA19386.1 tetratricopeptide repeat protein [Kiritimatiellia bacterium]